LQALRVGTWLFKPTSAAKLMDGISSVLGAPLTQGAPNDAVARNIEAIGRRYGARLNDDITQLEGAMAELNNDPTVQRHAWDAMRKTMHSAKGQAGTFGFGLITELARSAQDILDDTLALAPVEEHDIEVRRALHAIVTATRMLERGKMLGDGGHPGMNLLEKLDGFILPMRQRLQAKLPSPGGVMESAAAHE
jgi:HPt (histidine-containing phosphotransfer) domain-containing protein